MFAGMLQIILHCFVNYEKQRNKTEREGGAVFQRHEVINSRLSKYVLKNTNVFIMYIYRSLRIRCKQDIKFPENHLLLYKHIFALCI